MSQPDHTPPRSVITPPSSDVAPRARTPVATAPVMLRARNTRVPLTGSWDLYHYVEIRGGRLT